jgi:hypothetical protein
MCTIACDRRSEPSRDASIPYVTLRKSEADYSPTTLYDDWFVSPTEFRWESQSTTTESSKTGRRYITHGAGSSTVLLLVREAKRTDGRTAPYLCTGPAHCVRHTSECPMQITRRLEHPMPAALYPRLAAVAG